MRRLVAALAFLALPVLAACGNDDPTAITLPGQPGGLTGTFTLQTINGQQLPYFLGVQSGTTVELTSDVITLEQDGDYTERITYRATNAGQSQNSEGTLQGTYSLNGTMITFLQSGGGTFSATMSGADQFVVTDAGLTLIFKK